MPNRFFMVLIVFFIIFLGLTGCGHKAPPQPPSTPKVNARLALEKSQFTSNLKPFVFRIANYCFY